MARRNSRKSNGNGTPTLVGYCRVSTEEQAREGVSLDAQRKRLAAYCTAHGFELAGVESDEGLSGGVPPAQRPGLTRALEQVRRGEAAGLVVVKLDRLSRSVRDVLDLADSAQCTDWRLV
ncbi:MAG: recombinase family protein, partial [Gemmatimonadota bacterium]